MKNKLIKEVNRKFVCLIIIFLISKPFISIEFIINFLWIRNQYDSLENYLKLCCNDNIINFKNIKKSKEPKVSIISAVYNKEKYILRFIHSIQEQNFLDCEIVLIDDFSEDNSLELIKLNQSKFD